MSVMLSEQETTINFYRDSPFADIYTSDTTVMTRLDKLAENQNCPDWQLIKVEKSRDGKIVGKCYRTKKRLVSFRSTIVERTMSEEEKEEMRFRMQKMQEARKEKQHALQLQNHDDQA